MTHTQVNYDDVESKGGLYFLRDALECAELGLSVVDVDDGREGPAHDHAEEGHEEVYLLVDGSAELVVEDDPVELAPGDAVRVDPAATRELALYGDSTMVIAGAP